jgi:hypothetical protein
VFITSLLPVDVQVLLPVSDESCDTLFLLKKIYVSYCESPVCRRRGCHRISLKIYIFVTLTLDELRSVHPNWVHKEATVLGKPSLCYPQTKMSRRKVVVTKEGNTETFNLSSLSESLLYVIILRRL